MKQLRVRLWFPRRTRNPMHNFLVDHPGMHQEELWSWSFAGEMPTCLFRVEGDLDAYRERIADVDAIAAFELTPVTENWFYVFVHAEPSEQELEWMAAFNRSSIVVLPPIVYTDDGEAVFEVLGDPEDLRGMLTGLPDRVETTVERVGEFERYRSPDVSLTERQREVVRTAVDLGYYEMPREATLDDVAAELDVAASTVSDHLRKAEAELMAALA